MTISNTSMDAENTLLIDNSVKSISDSLYILKNGAPVKFDKDKVKLIKVSNNIYANPTEGQLRAAGYKPLALPDTPAEVDGYYISTQYDDSGEYIKATYSYIPVADETDTII